MSTAAARKAGASSVLVAALEAAWGAIVVRHPEVPDVVMIVASGSGHRPSGLKLGHFAAGRWDVAGAERPEVLVGGEGLRRGALDVLGTLLHEAAHGLGHARGARTTSRGGRYHNGTYRSLAIELGLTVAQAASHGWADTAVPETTAAAYARPLARIERALVLWRRAEMAGAGGKSRNPKVCSCGCGRRIRVADSTLAQGPILCGLCHEQFRCEA